MPVAEKQKITLGKLPNRALIDHIGELIYAWRHRESGQVKIKPEKNHQKAQEIAVVTY